MIGSYQYNIIPNRIIFADGNHGVVVNKTITIDKGASADFKVTCKHCTVTMNSPLDLGTKYI